MAFTPEEQAVLCQLSYKNIVTSELNPVTLHEILIKHQESLLDSLGEDYRTVLEGLIAKVDGKEYRIVKSVNDDKNSGFVGIAIADPNNDVTVVCRGTTNGKDWTTNSQIGLKEETNQQQVLENMIDDLEDCGYNNYSFTGHSLGGNLALHGAVYLGDPDRVQSVTTFNSPGFNNEYYRIYGTRLDALDESGKVVNYQNQHDYVGSIFKKPGKTIPIATVYLNFGNFFINHSIGNLRLREGGFDTKLIRSPLTQLIDLITDGIIDFVWDLSFISSYIYNKVTGGSITGYRDFSKAALKTMTDAARETEEEAWWRIDRWDCWYHAENFLTLGIAQDIRRLSGNVDTYYRRLIDMNNASVKDIEKIFQKVYDLDDTYSAKIEDGNAQLQSQVLTKLQQLADSISPKVCPAR